MRKKLPQYGQIRYKIKFAWLPVEVEYHRIWLERYFVIQKYRYGEWETQETGLMENLPTLLEIIHKEHNK